MSEHIGSDILDFLEGRLSQERMEEIRRHLAECEECAADVAWAREFREQAKVELAGHLPSERTIAIASTEVAPTEEERAHLEQCPTCRSELEWAKQQAPLETLLAEIDAPAPTKTSNGDDARREGPSESAVEIGRTAKRPRWLVAWGAAVAAAAAAITVILFRPTGQAPPPVPSPTPAPVPTPVSPIGSLAVLEPLPVHLTRGPAAPDSFEVHRIQGLEAYEAGQYSDAAGHLRRALERQPENDEVRLYLGSAELLRGDAAAARPLLDSVAIHSNDPVILDETLWQLANGLIRLENRSSALDALRRLQNLGGRHASRADSLISKLEAMPSGG